MWWARASSREAEQSRWNWCNLGQRATATPNSAFSQNHWWASPLELCKFLIFQHKQMYTKNVTTGLNFTMGRLREGREGDNRGWHGWMVSPTQNLGDGEGQGSLACYSPWGHKQSDTQKLVTEQQQGTTIDFWGKLVRPSVNSWGKWHSCSMFLFMQMTQGWSPRVDEKLESNHFICMKLWKKERKRHANKMLL